MSKGHIHTSPSPVFDTDNTYSALQNSLQGAFFTELRGQGKSSWHTLNDPARRLLFVQKSDASNCL